jgi:hypothetical protein
MDQKKYKNIQMNEKQVINNNNKIDLRRDSMSDRICDDLCEILFTYLSFEDKIKFECVSKQWQKLIFNKQFILDINVFGNHKKQHFLDKLLIPKNDNKFDLKAFESVLKKCKFINNIIIRESIGSEQMICQLINKHCLNLKSITLNLDAISDQTLKLFANKFGKKLENLNNCKFIDFGNSYVSEKIKSLLKECPNLLSLENINIIDLIDENQVLVPKLFRFDGFYGHLDQNKLNEKFFERYKSLKSLKLCVNPFNCDPIIFMKQISKLKNLQNLELILSDSTESHSSLFVRELTQIEIECKLINRLNLTFESLNEKHLKQLLISICSFKQLKYLSIDIFDMIYLNEDQMQDFSQVNDSIALNTQLLNGCKQLTHLKIYYPLLRDSFLADIHLFLPQLTHLKIGFEEFIYEEYEMSFSDQTMNSLAKLKHLKVIKLGGNDFSLITDSGIFNVINNCPEIKSIRLSSEPNITHKTIDAFIGLALKKPRICFYINFGHHLIETYESVPNNLRIKCNKTNLSVSDDNFESVETDDQTEDELIN